MDLINAWVLLGNFVIIPGLSYGSQLALGALGVTFVYGILRFSNFAHGDTMAFGTMVTIFFTWLFQSWGISLGPLPTALLALPLGIVSTVAFVLITDKWVYQHYRNIKAPPITLVMVSVGVMFVMHGLVRLLIGTGDQNFADGSRFVLKAIEFKRLTGLDEGLALRSSQLLTMVITVLLVSVLFWFLKSTRMGKAMRAYSDNENLALLSGINPKSVVMATWTIAAILATIAGVLYGLDKSFKPLVYFQLLLPIFAAAIVGGLGHPIGAIVGGFIIAFSEIALTYAYKKFLIYLLPEVIPSDSLMQLVSTEYKFAVSFVILVLVLLIAPQGIFKRK